MIFLIFIFISTAFIIKFSIYFCCKLSLPFRATIWFTNPDDLPHQLIRISEGLLFY
jgi:hypothetical protein